MREFPFSVTPSKPFCAGMAESNGTSNGTDHSVPHLALVPQRFTKVCFTTKCFMHSVSTAL